MKILVVGAFPEATQRRIGEAAAAEHSVVIVRPGELAEHLSDTEMLVPEHLRVDRALLERAPRLKLVQTGAGYDNIEIEECTRRGIWVANAAGVNAAAVAEHVLGVVICWYRNLISLDRAMREGLYAVEYSGSELSGRVLGVVGLGNIGRKVANLGRAFGMRVLGAASRPVEPAGEVEAADLDTLLRTSDVVTLHTPLDARTRQLIGSSELRKMKSDALLVNTSRGAVVNERALTRALEDRVIGGAALDVFEQEPLPADSPLRRLPNVILTPHTAGMPDGLKYSRRRFEFFLRNASLVSQGRRPLNALNQI